jgi:hypothetical protein
MATVIDKRTHLEWDEPTTRRKFPWDEWTNGEVWQAIEGEDFAANFAVFKTQLKTRAEKLGVEVKTRVEKSDGGPVSVFFQFVK